MPIHHPPKNSLGSRAAFQTKCVALLEMRPLRLAPAAIRHLRNTLAISDETIASAPDALALIFDALERTGKKRIELNDLREWIGANETDASAGAVATIDDLRAYSEGDENGMHFIRKVLDRKREKGTTYYLVDWEPTWEVRASLNAAVIATFNHERRALVRRKYIEYEAVEDNTLNATEH